MVLHFDPTKEYSISKDLNLKAKRYSYIAKIMPLSEVI